MIERACDGRRNFAAADEIDSVFEVHCDELAISRREICPSSRTFARRVFPIKGPGP